MRHLRPGDVLYEGVSLSDPETGKRLIKCRSVEAIESIMIDHRGEQRPALVLKAEQMSVDAAQWPKVNEALQRRLQGTGGGPELEIRLTAEELTLEAGGLAGFGEPLSPKAPSVILYHVEAGVAALPAGRQEGIEARLQCALQQFEGAERVQMRIVRNRQVSPPANGFEIDTGRAEFPCRLLGLAYGDLNKLGAKCRFCGSATLFHTSSGLAGEVHGRLADLDLTTAVGQNFGQSITGLAEVVMEQAVLRGGRLDAATGRIKAGPGTIGRPLVQSAIDHMQLTATQLPAGDEPVPFEMLGATFWLDERGLSLAGNCPGVPSATIVAGGQALLGEPARQPLPVGALVQVVSAGSNDSVPATQQALGLARYLPTPEGNTISARAGNLR
jgi:hypothetical protein